MEQEHESMPPGATITVYRLLARHVETAPDAPAIVAPGRLPLTYAALARQIERVLLRLNAMGLGRNTRIVQTLPDGPEAAVAFLSVASGAACCAVTPLLTRPECERYLSLVDPSALLTIRGAAPAMAEAVRERGLPIIELVADPGDAAGVFSLRGPGEPGVGRPVFAEPEDVALILHTSGTTGTPKAVPLTHTNICTSTAQMARALQLTPEDSWMCCTPMCHTHSLIGGVLASLAAGGSAVCPGPFDLRGFFGKLAASDASWFSAVPAVHTDILREAPAHTKEIEHASHRLRMIRSGGAALNVDTWRALEETFAVPVIVTYGLTECGPRLTHNPLPPGRRKPGSVGRSIGAEIAIRGDDGRFLPPGQVGEVVARGANVMRGYLNDLEANAGVFVDGWFRTGDLGYFDEEGYLFLAGRKKNVINRGGEKVSAEEVEAALDAHADVAESVVFGFPDGRVGEEVAAMVVLRPGGRALPDDLIRFCAPRLADFKVPRRIVFVDKLRRGATGKVKRDGLVQAMEAELSRTAPSAAETERDDSGDGLESRLAALWEEVLGSPPKHVTDNFFEHGGDSMGATRLLAGLEAISGVHVPPALFYREPTIEALCALWVGEAVRSRPRTLVPFRSSGRRPPLFFVVPAHPWVLVDVARYLDPDQRLYALHPLEVVDPDRPRLRIPTLAGHYVRCMKEVQPQGPYLIAGLSAGGRVAFQMAHQLIGQGEEVGLLAMVDVSLRPVLMPPLSGPHGMAVRWLRRLERMRDMSGGERLAALGRMARRALRRKGGNGEDANTRARRLYSRELGQQVVRLVAAHRRAAGRYDWLPYPGRIVYFWAEHTRIFSLRDPRLGWDRICRDGVVMHRVPGNHHEAMFEPHASGFARKLQECLDEAQAVRDCPSHV